MVKSASQNWELEHSTRTVLEETDCGRQRQEAEWMEDPTSLPRASPVVRAGASTSADIPGSQGSGAKDQEAPG